MAEYEFTFVVTTTLKANSQREAWEKAYKFKKISQEALAKLYGEVCEMKFTKKNDGSS